MKLIRNLIIIVLFLCGLTAQSWAVLDGGVCTTADKGGIASAPCSPTLLIGGINQEHSYGLQIGTQTLTNVTGSPNYTAAAPIPITAYLDQSFNIKFPIDNTGPLTLSISGLPAKPIVTKAGLALALNDVRATDLYVIRYYPANDQFRILNQSTAVGGGATALTEQTLSVASGTASWNMSLGADALLPITVTTTLANPINQTLFARGILRIKQGSVGGFALSLGTAFVVNNDSISLLNTAPFTQTEYNYHVIASSGAGSIELTPRNKALRQSAVIPTTSGTNIDFQIVPSWAKRITITFRSVRNNAGILLLQIGSGAIQSSGYVGGAFEYNSGSATSSATGFALDQSAPSTNDRDGVITLVYAGNNAWNEFGVLTVPNISPSSGGVTISGAISNIRVTTLTGTAFSAGFISALFE
jgi:hypothetical protein